MHVIATAGHVDHGKSTLVRLLTGMEPDRWAQERQRGMTIDLGFAWTTSPDGDSLAFVDVPGHERFVPTMLAGVGPVPSVLFMVAADEGWMPQSTEHLDALTALGVQHGLLVVTRCDLADPEAATEQALERMAGTSLANPPVVHVSASTGEGLDRLRAGIAELVRCLPAPDTESAVRLWIDRAFTLRGVGTVVTGTLRAGRLRVGDELRLHSTGRPVTVRGLHRMGTARTEVAAVARVAVNLRGVSVDAVHRGDALLTPQQWMSTELIDVRLRGAEAERLPRLLMVHIGSAAVAARLRPLGADTARLSLHTGLALRIGDRALIRDPGTRQILAGITVLDVRPPELTKRGAARRRATELATRTAEPDGVGELRRRRLIRAGELRAMGARTPANAVETAGWLLDDVYRDELATRLVEMVDAYQRTNPLAPGMPRETARRALELPEPDLLQTILETGQARNLTAHNGTVRLGTPELPTSVRNAVDAVVTALRARPFHAPTAQRLAELGLGARELAAAAEAGELLRIAPGIVLLPGDDRKALDSLATLPQPFTLSQARRVLDTSRRVAVPLMETLREAGQTEQLTDGSHRLRSPK